MPYADPELAKIANKIRNSKPEVRARNRELYQQRYSSNANGLADKVREKHHLRWSDPLYRERKKKEADMRWERDWSSQALVQIRARCKKTGIECNIEPSDIPLPDKCPVFGIPLFKSKGRLSANSPSVDRIDNTKGYVKGNVVVVSHKANSMKRAATVKEMRQLADFYEALGEPNE